MSFGNLCTFAKCSRSRTFLSYSARLAYILLTIEATFPNIVACINAENVIFVSGIFQVILCPGHPVSPSGSTNSVKFKFEDDMLCFSPTNSHFGNMNNRSESQMKILKKQNSIISKSADTESYLDLEMLPQKDMAHRSHSFGEAN